MFLTNKLGKAEVLEYDLGSTISERDEKVRDGGARDDCLFEASFGLVSLVPPRASCN